MIPFFSQGDPLSASKFNALGNSIRELQGGGAASAGELMTPQHFDDPPLPDMDFAVLFRKDSAGAWGWCYHKGRVIVRGKSHVVGNQDWSMIADENYTGEIKLIVTLDDDGEFVAAKVTKGKSSENGGNGNIREFPVASIGDDLVWQYGGGPAYVTEQVSVVGGTGIEVESSFEDGIRIFTLKGQELYSLSFVSAPDITIIDGMDAEKTDLRVVNIFNTYQLSFVEGPGIKIEVPVKGDKPGEYWRMVTISARSLGNVCVVGGHGIIVKPESGDDQQVFIVNSQYYITLTAGTGIEIIPESSTDPETEIVTQNFRVSTRIQIEAGNSEIRVNRDFDPAVLRFQVYGMFVCVVAGPGIDVQTEESEVSMSRIFTVKLCLSFVLGPGLFLDYSTGEEKLNVNISWVADQLHAMGWICAAHS